MYNATEVYRLRSHWSGDVARVRERVLPIVIQPALRCLQTSAHFIEVWKRQYDTLRTKWNFKIDKMTTTLPKNTYTDPEYEDKHLQTFARKKSGTLPLVLPPGVSETDYEKAIAEFVAAVGKDHVFVGEGLNHYVDPYERHDDDESKRKQPSAGACPGSVEEVRKVLEVANKYGVPVWTFSRGKNLGYGGPAPRVNGSVCLDLHRMNKIIEVNDQHAYAVVEPGVTFTDLYQYCVENKKKVWPSTASLGWGSVTGNALDRGTGFGCNSSHWQAISGMEVMLANGDSVRTGQFGITNSPSAFLSKFTYGPSIEGLFLQSNLGVVTKLATWMTPIPSAFMLCKLSVPEHDDIKALVDSLGAMRRTGLISNVVWVQNFIERLCIKGKRRDLWDGEGYIPDHRLEELQNEMGEDSWYASWGLYGPQQVVESQFNEIKEQLKQQLPTGKLSGHIYTSPNGESLDAASIPPEHGMFYVGIPSMFSLPLVDWAVKDDEKGKGAHGDYAPVIPNEGERFVEWTRVCKELYNKSGNELMCDFFMHERHSIFTNMFAYDQKDTKQCQRIEELWHGMHLEAKKRGYGMYRVHVNHMDLIADHNDFNDHAYLRFVETLKDAVDPNGILSPGKSGIWPRKYRHLRGNVDSGTFNPPS